MIVNPAKGFPKNVEVSKNPWGLSIEYVFVFIQKIAMDKVVGEWYQLFD